ncbi:IST1-like protein [Auxenochlorella protothecoides]|uniref:IST1-like protein n=1 Tax=Auxenochlorella protothecoides TaxID=3075 RepID=A0A087SPJ1_AUXPR|nr:IST1-like protein [Auxenochlorella protothecoides]KFM27645.1 IST1-like protein [Auxenochlorella protothecoides]
MAVALLTSVLTSKLVSLSRKTNCKLGISRIKLLRNKKQIAVRLGDLLKGFRREVADLLRAGKQGNARIRVESVIRETLLLQAFDTLEVYLELLAVRVELLAKTKEMPPDMMEAICSLIYAAERISSDLPEIAVIRSMLASKYGGLYKDFAQAAASDAHYREWQVNEGLVSCLSVEAPGAEQKIAVLESICEEHGIPFDAAATRQEMGQGRLYQPPARPEVLGGYKDAPAALAAAENYRRLASAAESAAARFSRGSGAGDDSGASPDGDNGRAPEGGNGGAPSSGSPPGFVKRSNSEIRRAYDAAPGYPSKGEIAAPGPPSAPPAAPGPGSPATGEDAPSPAATRPQGTPPPPGNDELEELESLTKRFEALKRR